jgi:hypothetical protein
VVRVLREWLRDLSESEKPVSPCVRGRQPGREPSAPRAAPKAIRARPPRWRPADSKWRKTVITDTTIELSRGVLADVREARTSIAWAERRLVGTPDPGRLAAVANRLGLAKIHAHAALSAASALVLATDASGSEDTLLAAHGLYGLASSTAERIYEAMARSGACVSGARRATRA